MGSPETELGRGEDELPHEVTITRGFFLQTTAVTQGQWKAVMGNNPSRFSPKGDDHPVESVSWYDCQKFIERLNSSGEHIYRLPTEAEWEYACRAGKFSSCSEGEIIELFCDHDPNLDAVGWYCGNSDRATHPVAQKKPNPWGLYDLHGNVLEWCQDWYGTYPATPQTILRVLSLGQAGLFVVVRGFPMQRAAALPLGFTGLRTQKATLLVFDW